VRSDLRTQQAAYARAEANWREIKRSLAAESSKSPALATRVRQIDQDLAAIEADKRAERDSLANQVKLLQQELDAGVYD
jgi:septal ring factor EnvC (AmiA/AmiB activator)